MNQRESRYGELLREAICPYCDFAMLLDGVDQGKGCEWCEERRLAVKASASSETGPSEVRRDTLAEVEQAIHDARNVILALRDEKIQERAVGLAQAQVIVTRMLHSERPRPTLAELMPDTNADGSYTYRPKRRAKGG